MDIEESLLDWMYHPRILAFIRINGVDGANCVSKSRGTEMKDFWEIDCRPATTRSWHMRQLGDDR